MGNSHSGGAAVAKFYTTGTWIEGRAEDQLAQVAAWPGMVALAAFPDLHPGRHGPVGAAFLADRIYPQLIGPDIGCGMALFGLDLPRHRLKLDKAVSRLRALESDPAPDGMGTLGGGNHFCEVQVVSAVMADTAPVAKGDTCLLVHTGSRGLGAAIFNALSERWVEGFAPDTQAALDYLARHDKAVAFARQNRLALAERAAAALRCDFSLICDAVHNHVEAKGAFWLHRKGAARADNGLAPLAGSRDTLSYLLRVPDGPPEALASLSHGSGRRYDRSSMHGRIRKTRSALDAMTRNRFGGQIICDNRDLLLEEAPLAYKDPASVVSDLQSFGLAEPLAALQPLITYKTVRTLP
jgi:release factor H-coupled RctB family protein